MNCSYHPTVEQIDFCSVCTRPLCGECSHRIKGRTYCQDCLVRGAEWAGTVKDLRVPADAPKRAALCSIIPGIGAVYNGEYVKALTYFAVFAALAMMGDQVHGVFGFGAVVFLIFTMFDSYRTAELHSRLRLEGREPATAVAGDRSNMAWGVFLVALGVVFLLQNVIPDRFLDRLWPLVFILLGGYLIYRTLQDRESGHALGAPSIAGEKKEY
jgi:hypothetical protein